MEIEVRATVVSAAKQWWLKINTKPVRLHALDGAIFPYIIKVRYTADGKDYFKRKWIRAGDRVPDVGSTVRVYYFADKPSKARVMI